MSDDGQKGTTVSKHVRRSRPLRAAVGIGVIFTLLCLPGLAAAATTKQEAKPTLTIGLPFAPVSLDPSKDGAGFLIVRALTNTAITHIKPDGSIGPGLATAWRYLGTGGRKKGPDAGRGPNKDFEFTLRRNARFSDGTGVTAKAVKLWLEYFAKGNGAFASLMGPIQSIDTVGKWKVRLHLSSPNPVLPRVLSELYNWGAVSSAKAVAEPSVLGTQTVGAGPYMLDPSETVTNDHYTLVPNPYYYDKSAIRFSKVVAKVIPTASSMLQAVQTGQIDVGQGASATADAAEASGLKVVHAPNGYAGFILADRKGAASKPLADVRVRQALNYAVDRKAVTSAVVGKWGTPLAEMSSADGFVKKYANHYPYNPAKTKSLLAAAGYPNGFTLEHLGLTSSYTQAIAKYLGDRL